jgi:hypothetical protein
MPPGITVEHANPDMEPAFARYSTSKPVLRRRHPSDMSKRYVARV